MKKTAKQKELSLLLSSDVMHIMVYGGSGSGKTFYLFRCLIIRALKCESRHIIFRSVFAHIKSSIWYNTYPDVMKKCFPELRKDRDYFENKSDWFIRFKNGSEIWFAGLDDKERTEKVLGNEYSTVYFNECSMIAYSSILLGMTRLRQNVGLKLKAYYDCNPPFKTHWTYLLVIKKLSPGTKVKINNPDNYQAFILNPLDNRENLPKEYLETLENLPKRQKARFWYGSFSDDVEGALWTYQMINDCYVKEGEEIEPFIKIVVAIDPSITAKGTSDETGIIVCAKSLNYYYILEDASSIMSVSKWAELAVKLYDKYEANAVVAEVNQGGDLVEANIRNVRREIRVKKVRATKGKYKRAEPVAGLYEMGLVKHIKPFAKLEDQMQSYTNLSTDSPDRLDGAVWGITYLMEKKPQARVIA